MLSRGRREEGAKSRVCRVEASVTVALIAVGVAGLWIGSFLDRCVRRLRFEKSAFWPISDHCERRYQPIPWWSRLPLLGFLLSRGRCRSCGQHLEIRRLLIELLTAALLMSLYWIRMEGQQAWLPPFSQLYYARERLFALFVYHGLLVSFLIVATFIDLDLMIIPDSVTIPGMLLGVGLGTFWCLELHPILASTTTPLTSVASLLPGEHWHMNWNRYLGFATGMAGLLAGGALVWVVRAVCSWVFGREAMGFGDVTLMAMIGSFVGWQTVILIFFLAPVSAVVVGLVSWIITGRSELPYGPHLSIAAIGCIFAWNPIWLWAFPLFSFDAPLLLAGAVVMLVMLMMVATALQAVKRLFGVIAHGARS